MWLGIIVTHMLGAKYSLPWELLGLGQVVSRQLSRAVKVQIDLLRLTWIQDLKFQPDIIARSEPMNEPSLIMNRVSGAELFAVLLIISLAKVIVYHVARQ